ncbi:MAG: hypothetical protein ABSD32_17275, partial [Mycobacterium sp.]
MTVFDSRPKSGRCICDVTAQRVDRQKSRLARFRASIERRCVDAVHGESITKLDLLVPGQELLNALLIATTGESNEDATAIGHSLCSRRFQQISDSPGKSSLSFGEPPIWCGAGPPVSTAMTRRDLVHGHGHGTT